MAPKNSKQSLKLIAYDSIKNKILNCEYMPNSFLNEDLLCEELGVSRTPIRDALGRLEQEHLISILPKKGFIVAPFSVREINMVFEGRLLIEPYIILNYCDHFPKEKLDRMYEILESTRKEIASPEGTIYALDNEFHECITSQCTNRYILRTLTDISNQNCRLRIMSGIKNENRLHDTIDEHFQILDCLSKEDLAGAAEAIKVHLIKSRDSSYLAFMSSDAEL